MNVECRASDMVVHLNTNMPFKGRLYARNKSKNCSLDVNNSLDFSLPISLNETACGTVFQVIFLFTSSFIFLRKKAVISLLGANIIKKLIILIH